MVVTESIDILRYIEEQFPDPPLYTSAPEQRREVDNWMDTATNNHVRVVKTFMYSTVLGASKKPGMMDGYIRKQKNQELVGRRRPDTALVCPACVPDVAHQVAHTSRRAGAQPAAPGRAQPLTAHSP